MAKVVFCEDDSLIQKMIRMMLRGTDHTLLFAADGEEGLALIERERPDVVFTDLWMPGIDGLELRRRLRAQAPLADIPVILVTGAADDARLATESDGTTAVLAKPFTPVALREMVERYAG